jgi:antitoxin StbD
MSIILTQKTASLSELKRCFSDVLKEADDGAIAILSHNKAKAYLLSATLYENLMNYLEDTNTLQERVNGTFIEFSLDEL